MVQVWTSLNYPYIFVWFWHFVGQHRKNDFFERTISGEVNKKSHLLKWTIQLQTNLWWSKMHIEAFLMHTMLFLCIYKMFNNSVTQQNVVPFDQPQAHVMGHGCPIWQIKDNVSWAKSKDRDIKILYLFGFTECTISMSTTTWDESCLNEVSLLLWGQQYPHCRSLGADPFLGSSWLQSDSAASPEKPSTQFAVFLCLAPPD
jgi:hypothetical protein